MSASRKHLEVLIAGAGCTGALVAALLRHKSSRCGHVLLKLSVWEWGRGPAGRMTSFWVDIDGERVLADVGAQVISVRSPEKVPLWLVPHITSADGIGLAKTAERSEEWHHFFSPGGLPALQRASLEEAQLDELHFNRRVVHLARSGQRWRVGYAGEKGGRKPVGFQEFDLVVFAGTAADAGGLDGLMGALSTDHRNGLSAVRYDHRLCVALMIKSELAVRVAELCQGCAELAVDADTGGPISLVSRQAVKGRTCAKACAVVVHSTTSFAAYNLQESKRLNRSPSDSGTQVIIERFAELLGMSYGQLEAHVLQKKTVHWRQCQVQKAMAVPGKDNGAGPQSCLVASEATHLILAGDYLAPREVAGSFEGCLASADAAAREACRLLFPSAVSDEVVLEDSVDAPGSTLQRSSLPKRWQVLTTDAAPSTSEERPTAASARGRRWQRNAIPADVVHDNATS